MGFNPIFYAGRPKLSEVTIDSDLDMGTYSIKTNTINERTVGNGVVVDGVICKDGMAVFGV